MYPNPSVTGQFTSPALTGALPTVPIRYPPNMIKTINNNHPITTMASPFFVDNLLQHQKAAVNFQSQFVNSQLQSYIQEQHHQFMIQQSQLRHQQALKYAAANLQDGYIINNNDQHRKNSLERISGFSPQHLSRGNSPNSEEASPRMDYEEDDEHLNHTRKHEVKEANSDARDASEPQEYSSPRNVNGRTSAGEVRSTEFDETENKEENSHSADEEIYTEDSPSRSPINNDISSTVKSELQMSPTNYDQQRFYGGSYQEKYDEKKEPQEDSRGNKEDFQEEPDVNTNNDSDTESRPDRKILRNSCSNCGSYECNPFYPSCKNYGANNLGIRRYDMLERRISNDSLETGYRSPGRNEINGDERLKFGDKESHLDILKRTSLESGHVVQKPVLKFSVSAILGDQNTDGDRTAATSGVKVGHPQDGFAVHGSGVFSIPGFPLAPIAKPIASRPPTFPPHLHSLLAHCRQHPYLTVGGNPSGPVFMTGGGAGAPFPWAGGARGKPRRGMMRRAVFSDTQRRGLERRFQLQKYISKPDRKKLAEKLGLKDSQVKIWFQNRRMKWRNSKERELLASGGSREQTLPNKNNPHPDLSDAEADRPKLSPLSPPSPEQDMGQSDSDKLQKTKFSNSSYDSSFEGGNKGSMNDSSYGHYNPDGCLTAPNLNGVRSYSLMAADDAMAEDFDSDNGSGSDEEINVT